MLLFSVYIAKCNEVKMLATRTDADGSSSCSAASMQSYVQFNSNGGTSCGWGL